MPIRPFDITQNEVSLPEELNDILINSGLQDKPVKDSKINNARDAFNKSGASLDDAAKTISMVMRNGETENARLKASELVLKVHGILNEIDDKNIPQIIININGSENKTLVNLVLPTL